MRDHVGIRGVVVLHFLNYTNFLVRKWVILKVKKSGKPKFYIM